MVNEMKSSAQNSLKIINEIFTHIYTNALAMNNIAKQKLTEKSIECKFLYQLHTSRLFILLSILIDQGDDNKANLLKVIRKLPYSNNSELKEHLEEIYNKYEDNGLFKEIKFRRDKVFAHIESSLYNKVKVADHSKEIFLKDWFIDLRTIINELNEAFEIPNDYRHENLLKSDFADFYQKISNVI